MHPEVRAFRDELLQKGKNNAIQKKGKSASIKKDVQKIGRNKVRESCHQKR